MLPPRVKIGHRSTTRAARESDTWRHELDLPRTVQHSIQERPTKDITLQCCRHLLAYISCLRPQPAIPRTYNKTSHTTHPPKRHKSPTPCTERPQPPFSSFLPPCFRPSPHTLAEPRKSGKVCQSSATEVSLADAPYQSSRGGGSHVFLHTRLSNFRKRTTMGRSRGFGYGEMML